ncbi:metallophosphoesterase [Consotaella aegiceratis]|uniref:metallophosphoesterase n=1 Tax=Consotaella aegiceratis TaxID=3097961 RepID=UPI002F40F041
MQSWKRPQMPLRPPRSRLRLDLCVDDDIVYAVGDVHGALKALLALEDEIVEDAKKFSGRKAIVMLGDYVDRGPASAQVINHLLAAPPHGFERLCLAGNHEILMLDYLEGRIGRSDWLRAGATATLASYGIDSTRLAAGWRSSEAWDEAVEEAIPPAHRAFLRDLPILIETDRHLLVHAGLRPNVALADQSDHDLAFIRSEFLDVPYEERQLLVHGHTPITEPKLEGRRLNIDTGACFSGRLTAVRLWRATGRFLVGRG